MPRRNTLLSTNEYYHIFNRGVAKLPTFFIHKDYERFVKTLEYYQFLRAPTKMSYYLRQSHQQRIDTIHTLIATEKRHVEIVCYSLMPNHFHLLVKQCTDDGISVFMRHIGDSYTKYINTRHNRVGPLFQGTFKAIRIEDDEQLLHVSRYIHINPVVSHIIKPENLQQYPWSSLQDYIHRSSTVVNSSPILSNFSSINKYMDFLTDHLDYTNSLDTIKHLTYETP